MNFLCKNGWHKFKARYSHQEPSFLKRAESIKGLHLPDAYLRIYIKDVCVRCGKVAGDKD